MSLFDTRYSFFSAYLKGGEAKLLNSQHVNKITKTPTVSDILVIIRETDAGNYLQGATVEKFEDIDALLWQYLDKCLKQIEWLKPVPTDMAKLMDAYLLKYDVLNIKAALLGISMGKQSRGIPAGALYQYGLLDTLLGTGKTEDVTNLLKKTHFDSFERVIKQYSKDGETGSDLVAQALDSAYFENLLNVTKSIRDGGVLARAYGIIVDMTNLRIITRAIIGGTTAEVANAIISGGYVISKNRAKELLTLKLPDLPNSLNNTPYSAAIEELVTSYNNTKSITVIEEIIDKYKFKLTREILAPRILSPLVVAWYLILKEIEIRNLRLILKAAFDNIPMEKIKNYLVLMS